jgi:hypothetical protein
VQKALNDTDPEQNVWVGNVGMSARNTRHHLAAMQYLPIADMKIDTVVLLIGINDLTNRLKFEGRQDPSFLARPEVTGQLINRTFRGGSHLYTGDAFYKKTAIWDKLRRAKRRFSSRHYAQDEDGKAILIQRRRRQQAA